MRIPTIRAGNTLVALACAGLLALALALPAAGAQQQARDGHSLVKKLPKKWLAAHRLAGTAARPLADPDRDGACNWVEFRQRTDPRKANAVATTPPATTVPASRIILLEGTVVGTTPTALTLELDGGLVVDVALAATAPVVDAQGLTTIPVPGQGVHVFVSQTADRALSAVLVLVDDDPAAGDPGAGDEPENDDDDGDHHHGGAGRSHD